MSELRETAINSTFFALEPLFLRFFKMDKTGVIYMSIPFHSRIARQNQSKYECATLKVSKITLLGLDAKGNKNRKFRNKHPTSDISYMSIAFHSYITCKNRLKNE